jgi:hypothetical protein
LRRHTTGGAATANVAPFCARTTTNHKILPFDGIVLDSRHKVLYAAASTC